MQLKVVGFQIKTEICHHFDLLSTNESRRIFKNTFTISNVFEIYFIVIILAQPIAFDRII